jgi:16S rRNA (guanine527-N7)-methyltransferase
VDLDTASLLADRSAEAGVTVPPPLAERLVVYYDLLQRWNRTINLTSLTTPDEAIDRLLLEPVVAAASLSRSPRLVDLGSGGGSPAIPLALALSATLLVMVESRSRKAAFLREALRELGLAGEVDNSRFEEAAAQSPHRGTMDIVSIRAVKVDDSAFAAAGGYLSGEGRIALFESIDATLPRLPAGFLLTGATPLLERSRLTIVERI